MIAFDGYISGKAKNFYRKKSRRMGRNIFFFSMGIFSPAIIVLAINFESWVVIIGYISLFAIVPLLFMIPQGEKADRAMTPKRIYTDGEYIVCIADKVTESRLINDVKQVNEYDEFYELVFPFGKLSEKFICQKSLLSEGALEDFEKLFDGKLKRQVKTGDGSLS